MAYIHKKNSRWHVDIRKKGFPSIYKSFLDLKDASLETLVPINKNFKK